MRCGGIVVLCVPPLIPFLLLYYLHGQEVVANAPAAAMANLYLGLYIACILAIGMSIVSSILGIRALFSASWNRQPADLPLAGTLVSATALVVSILMAIGSMMMIIRAFPARRL